MTDKSLNVEGTAEIIDGAAKVLRDRADALDRVARLMREKNDLSYAAEALSEIVNAPMACRLDLLVLRSHRALQK